MRKTIKNIISIVLVLLSFPAILACIFLLGWFSGRIENHLIRNEVFEYVLNYKAIIESEDSNKYQEFFYTATGLQDGGTEYGYYYEPDDEYNFNGEPYRTGYRTYGIPDDTFDWYYEERICENWFYYEIHDG